MHFLKKSENKSHAEEKKLEFSPPVANVAKFQETVLSSANDDIQSNSNEPITMQWQEVQPSQSAGKYVQETQLISYVFTGCECGAILYC